MNSTPMPSSSSSPLPWYRFFLPWLALLLVSSAVIASFVSAYYAVHTQDVVLEHADASN
jgi:hypothetical protein